MKKFFWTGENFKLYTVAQKNFVSLALEKKGQKIKSGDAVFFSKKEFFSFICELVKYILELPEVAREIPFYESCATSLEKPHGLYGTVKIQKNKQGQPVLPLNPLWLRYHGMKQGDTLLGWKEKGMWVQKPAKTKAKIINDVKNTRCKYIKSTINIRR